MFVSWFFQTPLETLLDALREFLKKKQLPNDTKFWVCDFVIQQATRKISKEDNDVKKLGDCVHAIEQTVLLLEPWNDSQPLRRAYCIKEIYNTQAGWAKFDVVMSSAQQASFEDALINDIHSVTKDLSNVNVREAVCLNKEDTIVILEESRNVVGFEECNRLVSGLL